MMVIDNGVTSVFQPKRGNSFDQLNNIVPRNKVNEEKSL